MKRPGELRAYCSCGARLLWATPQQVWDGDAISCGADGCAGKRPAYLDCSVAGCPRPVRARGVCDTHYRAILRRDTTCLCTVPDCGRALHARGLCTLHYARHRAAS